MSIAHKIAIIGAGGKTTTLQILAAHKRSMRVLATTTTHFFPMYPPNADRLCINPLTDELTTALSCPGITCAGTRNTGEKLSSLSPALLSLADQYADYILYEADGSRRMPLKLHSHTEPVILPHTAHCIILAGLSAFGRPLSECVHRYMLHPEWSRTPNRPVDAQIILTCVKDAIHASRMPTDQITILLNQADICKGSYYEILQQLSGLRCAAVSLQRDGLPTLLSSL